LRSPLIAILVVGSFALMTSCTTTSYNYEVTISDGDTKALEVAAAKAHVVVFITVDCPIANGFAPTIQTLAGQFGSNGIRFFLVHVDPDVGPADARKHASEYGYELPIILDTKHHLVRKLKASHTPEAFIIRKDGSIAYRGRINDLYGDLGKKRPKPRTHDLRNALESVKAGRPVAVARTEPVGCFMPEI